MREILNRLKKHKNEELEKERKKNNLVKQLIKKSLNKRDGVMQELKKEIEKAKR